MRLLIVLAILAGWLATEIKEFIIAGGINNTLAFSLLKICFILFMIIILVIMISFYDLVVELIGRINKSYFLSILDRNNFPNETRITPTRRNSG